MGLVCSFVFCLSQKMINSRPSDDDDDDVDDNIGDDQGEDDDDNLLLREVALGTKDLDNIPAKQL